MNSNFYINMALSVLFEVLQEKGLLTKYERAFRKLATMIAMAYGWSIQFEVGAKLDFAPKA